MPNVLGWIRQFHKPHAPELPPLLVFPHAGSGASTYRAFTKVASENFDPIVFQYPGRQDRAREAGLETLPEIAAGAFAEFLVSQHNTGAPITVFGHSMGAIVAFEFVRLAEAAGIDVRLLTVSAAVWPSRVAELPPHPTEDEQLLDHMTALNGTGDQVLASRDVMKMALPVMKMDYRAFDAYSCGTEVTVTAPIHAIGGDEDPFVTPADLYGWSRHTTADAQVTLFDGGHFYLDENARGIVELLAPQAIHRASA